jgi:hypothetical protein
MLPLEIFLSAVIAVAGYFFNFAPIDLERPKKADTEQCEVITVSQDGKTFECENKEETQNDK